MEPLAVSEVAPAMLANTMARLGAAYMKDRSNDVRHVYFSRRLNRWFAVSRQANGLVRVAAYAQCPCAMRA